MTASVFVSNFGISGPEAYSAAQAARRLLTGQQTREALQEMQTGAPLVAQASRDLLHSRCFTLLSEAGFGTVVSRGGDRDEGLRTFEDYIRELLVDPILVRDLSVWVLFFALRDAADRFRQFDCRAPFSEGHLDGKLLGEVQAACERWAKVVEGPLVRYNSATVLQKIDLSILGGEQAKGGDLGIIIDFDGRSLQPCDEYSEKPRGRRIVPIILQSKRYQRPNADISQHHKVRGYQRRVLARNVCASAYLFYENGKELIDSPLPPIVKPASAVADSNTTPVIAGGLDLAAYLIGGLLDHDRFPGAATPAEALRMIYAKGRPSHLAVIAGDPRTAAYYNAEFQTLAEEIRHRGEDERPWIQT